MAPARRRRMSCFLAVGDIEDAVTAPRLIAEQRAALDWAVQTMIVTGGRLNRKATTTFGECMLIRATLSRR